MPRVQFTGHLRRYFPDLEEIELPARTAAELVHALDQRWPGMAGFLVDERGALRRHVNVFVGDELIRDREGLTDALEPDAQVFVMQALSGG